jgi:hypothetical protein
MLQTYCTVQLSCRDREYEPNAIWTGQIEVKTKILCMNQPSGKTVNKWKRIFEFTEIKPRFMKKKM